MAETLTFTGTCDAVSSLAQSNWSAWSACYQGIYGSGNPSRFGVMLFSTLRNSITWNTKSITEIRLILTFGKAGHGSREKTLFLHQGTQTSITGTGTNMKGESIGEIPTNGKAYGTTNTITFNSSTNSTAFTNLLSWLKNTSSTTLCTYTTEAYDSGYGYSPNYLQITAATLEVDCSSGGTIRYGVNGSFVECEVYYATGGSFVKVEPYYATNNTFVPLG